MFTKILVPIDGSLQSDAAVDLALRMAAASNANVTFVHAVELSRIAALSGPSAIDPSIAIDAACQAGNAILGDAKQKATDCGVSSETLLLEDECIRSVMAAARQIKADLIVVGSHGRSGISRALLGSVAEGILRHSNVPVLVCHAPPVQPVQKPNGAIKREVLVAEQTML